MIYVYNFELMTDTVQALYLVLIEIGAKILFFTVTSLLDKRTEPDPIEINFPTAYGPSQEIILISKPLY